MALFHLKPGLNNCETIRRRLKFSSGSIAFDWVTLGIASLSGEGVYELRIHYGPGYRVYFGQVGVTLVLLLCGGDKSTQVTDIRQAKEYWKDYAKRRSTP